MTTRYDALFHEVAREVGVEDWVLKALAMAESSLNETAYRHGPGERKFWKRRIRNREGWKDHRYHDQPEIIAGSYGLMQVLYTTACECGFEREGDWWLLFEPGLNVTLGARYFRRQLDRYGNISAAISAYNAGGLYLREGENRFTNQHYVDRVMRFGGEVRQEWGLTPVTAGA